MTVYVIVQLTFKKRDAYDRYQARFADVFNRFNGQLLAADEKPQLLEGQWQGNKIVLLSFPDESSYRDWADSPAYQEIAKDRKAGADAVALLVRGMDSYRR
ncbi:DUF1330 domain-containing protein [Noviherbaspirillum sp.]|uniref:DUF1330 domain-containing protein n=1 Tax=Noviherbaspirillum sp. TaxID=1926288 RepID=UPI002FDF9F22